MGRFSSLKSDLLNDVNPRSWVMPFRNCSVWYLVIMAIFYHVISRCTQEIGNLIPQIQLDFPFPHFYGNSINQIIGAPVEEVLLFGLPFYLLKKRNVRFILGIIWSIFHMFNTVQPIFGHFDFVSLFATVPMLFLSLRSWASNKGWLSIVFHTFWNLFLIIIQLSAYTSISFNLIFGAEKDLINSAIFGVIASALLFINFLIYKRKRYSTKTT
ncbi:MAG TPA: CPBP family glutamic-type intramembrane protease [Nitrosopumilaceae archaeon]|nr:CPBP family glutamic-type intramembrane protease [Nitrosopumilaceae archaeon]